MRERDWRTKPRSRGAGGSRHGAPRERQTDVVLYGWHSVTAALANPARHIRRLLATENALRRLNDEGIGAAEGARNRAAGRYRGTAHA